jgi:hypothetical protein
MILLVVVTTAFSADLWLELVTTPPLWFARSLRIHFATWIPGGIPGRVGAFRKAGPNRPKNVRMTWAGRETVLEMTEKIGRGGRI